MIIIVSMMLKLTGVIDHSFVLDRDADDAFSLENIAGSGGELWRLGVHIADLSPWTTDR